MKKENNGNKKEKTLESWLWKAACSIRGVQDAPKYKDFILPLVFTKRLCDVFDDELNRIAEKVGSRAKAFKLVARDHKLVRFFLPLQPEDSDDTVWSVIRKLSDKIGEQLTTHLRSIDKVNPLLQGILDRIDFNATTHGQRDLDDNCLSNLIERISQKRLGLSDVEPDIIGRSYEYLIRKFAEGSGRSAGEFYTPLEVGMVIARIMNADEGMTIYDPCCGSAGLLIKCELMLDQKMKGKKKFAPLQLYGQENIPGTWAMANMNMIIHDMEGRIEIGDTFRLPKFREAGRLQTFDRVVANPMWNQTEFTEQDYENDEFDRFPSEAGYPGGKADWGWIQHIIASTKKNGKAAVILGAGSASRGSGENKTNLEKNARKYFVENDFLEAVILLPYDLFYNTDAPGLIYIFNKSKPKALKGNVLFINATEGYKKSKPKNLLTNEWASKIVELYRGPCHEEEGISKIVSIEDIHKLDYHLRPSRYVYRLVQPDGIDMKLASNSYAKLSNEIIASQSELTNALESVSMKTSADSVENIFGIVRKDCDFRSLEIYINEHKERAKDTKYPVLSCSKIHGIILQDQKFKFNIASEDASNYKVAHPGMFVYDPMLLWDGSIGLNRYDFSGMVSPAYTVFNVITDEINIEYLEFVLRSKIMIPFFTSISDGTNMRRRKAKFSDFKKLKIPIIDENAQLSIASSIRLSSTIEKLSEELKVLRKSTLKSFMIV